jgi:predicted N-acetyltransferase YhbS
MQIRQATAGDAATIAALWTEAYAGPGPGESLPPYEVAEVEEALASGCVLVVEEGGRVIGVVVLYPPGAAKATVAEAGEAELARLAVTRPARRRGVGLALAQRCIDVALEAEYGGLVLWSRAHQTAAHELYERLDFVRLPARDSADALGPRLVFGIDLRGPR